MKLLGLLTLLGIGAAAGAYFSRRMQPGQSPAGSPAVPLVSVPTVREAQ
ncbi:MAG: hypothetical protein R2720_08415 [Candidatus Nanopelagicales bacterium]